MRRRNREWASLEMECLFTKFLFDLIVIEETVLRSRLDFSAILQRRATQCPIIIHLT